MVPDEPAVDYPATPGQHAALWSICFVAVACMVRGGVAFFGDITSWLAG